MAKARDAGVPVTERWTEHLGFGVAYRTDIHALHAPLGGEDRRPAAEHAGAALLVDGGRVRGVVAGGEEIHARAVLLASGGFQGDKELVKRFLGWDADRMLVRSNRAASATASGSRSAAGAAASTGLGTFYGHTVASPLSAFEPRQLPAAGPVPLEVVHPREPARPPLHRRGAGRRGVQPDDAAPAGRARRAAVRRRACAASAWSARRTRTARSSTASSTRAAWARGSARRRQRRRAGRAGRRRGASTPRADADARRATSTAGRRTRR